MYPTDFIVYVINSLLGENVFQLMTLSDISLKASSFTYWTQIFDVQFLASILIYLSIIWFVWAMTYRLVSRVVFHLINYPKKRKNK